jgi:hypothetical protein
MLWASGALTHTWTSTSGMTPVVADTIKAAPTANTTYYVAGIGSNGCRGVDSLVINISADPLVKITLSDSTPCFKDTVMLYGSGAKTYSWSHSSPTTPNFATGDTVSQEATRTREYWVTGTDSNGCVGMDTANVTDIKAWPSESVSGFVEGLALGSSTEVCKDQTLTLKANHGNNTYKWSSNATLSDSTGGQTSLLVTTNTTVTIKVDSSNGCSNTILNSYSPNSVKPAMILSWKTDSTICVGDTAKVDVLGADTYLWSPGDAMIDSTSTNGVFIPIVTTPYSVKGIQRGCVATLNMNIIVNPLPDISLTQSSNGSTLCADVADTITITSNSGVLFDWGFGVISTDKIKSLLPGKKSTVTIKAISAKGCIKSSQITINVDTTCGERVGIDEPVRNSDIRTYIVDGGQLHLKFGAVPAGNVEIELINMTGAIAKSFNLGEIVSENERILNVSELPKGIYLLRVRSDKYEIVNKVMH